MNVLVGPNGSGKTNFIEFLDFLSTFLSDGASTATSRAGGLARVFSQETLKSKVPRVVASISGLADLKNHLRGDEERTLFRFQYDIDIRYSKHHATIFVASESIKFKSCFWNDLAVYVDRTVGTVSVKRKNPHEETIPEVSVGKRLLTRGPKNPLRFRSTRSVNLSKRGDVVTDENLIVPTLSIDQSILSVRSLAPAFDAVREALTRGRSFNLAPARARTPDDLSRSPFILADGSGLSSVLYHMQRAPQGSSRGISFRRFDSESLEKIIAWTSLVLPELESITTSADPQTGKYLSSLVVSTASDTLKIPLQSASDGTLKWLSFVSLLLSHGSIYSLEEPENYLHPRMQSFLVDLIRETLNSDHPGYFLMTTHSESIINQCKPEELLLFEFCEGKTCVKRLDNPDKVRDEINRTGFGLGYYYAANAVS